MNPLPLFAVFLVFCFVSHAQHIVWEYQYDTLPTVSTTSLIKLSNGNIVSSGTSPGACANSSSQTLFNSDGAVLWTNSFSITNGTFAISHVTCLDDQDFENVSLGGNLCVFSPMKSRYNFDGMRRDTIVNANTLLWKLNIMAPPNSMRISNGNTFVYVKDINKPSWGLQMFSPSLDTLWRVTNLWLDSNVEILSCRFVELDSSTLGEYGIAAKYPKHDSIRNYYRQWARDGKIIKMENRDTVLHQCEVYKAFTDLNFICAGRKYDWVMKKYYARILKMDREGHILNSVDLGYNNYIVDCVGVRDGGLVVLSREYVVDTVSTWINSILRFDSTFRLVWVIRDSVASINKFLSKIVAYEGDDYIVAGNANSGKPLLLRITDSLVSTGIETSSEESKLQVQPNPVSKCCRFSLSNTSGQVTIYNGCGLRIRQEQVENEATLDFSDLASGIYMAVFVGNNHAVVKHFLVCH